MKEKIRLHVNGDELSIEISQNQTLLWLLREELGLTGTKEGCGAGECGACTVILNGQAVNSCQTSALSAAEGDVHTIEGEPKNGELSSLQKAFIKHTDLQCGFCTPGMIMSARALLNRNPNPNKQEIFDALKGNLCRCSGFESIVKSVEAAVKGDV
jgi:aerobic-type carbon monoxide dehydrogenase small subunit (CoxS/CutS family)